MSPDNKQIYCSKCGSALSNKEAKFCHECGSGLNESVTSRKAENDLSHYQILKHLLLVLALPSPLKNSERSNKKKERPGLRERKEVLKEKEKKSTEVIIQIGLMKLRDRNLKIVRGSTLPLKVLPRIESNELLKKSVEKMLKFNKDIRGSSDHFTLVYPDQTAWRY